MISSMIVFPAPAVMISSRREHISRHGDRERTDAVQPQRGVGFVFPFLELPAKPQAFHVLSLLTSIVVL